MKHGSKTALAALLASLSACHATIQEPAGVPGDVSMPANDSGDASGSPDPAPDVLPDGSLPIVPGGRGFAIATPAGSGRHLPAPSTTVYRVKTLVDDGGNPDSLRHCVDRSGPRVCVFEVSGTIKLNDDLVVRNPYLTVAGQTAPSPGILLRGATLRIVNTHDVLIQHLRIRVGDDLDGPDFSDRDGLVIGAWGGNTVHGIVIDHCSFSWATDEMVSMWDHWDDITFNNNIFAEPLFDSLHPKGTHGYGAIAGGESPGKFSMVGNVFASTFFRNPLSYAASAYIANNVLYNTPYGISIGTHPHYVVDTAASVIGNVYVSGPDRDHGGGYQPMTVAKVESNTSRIFLSDYAAPGAAADPWDAVTFTTDSGYVARRAEYDVSSPPTTIAGFVPMATASNAVYDAVLARAGARPGERDQIDLRLVSGIRNLSGRIINCVSADGSERCEKNAGGWPDLPQNTRPLTLPEDPDGLAKSGYTNLEEWLHEYAHQVEMP